MVWRSGAPMTRGRPRQVIWLSVCIAGVMTTEIVIIWLLVGLASGWLASQVVRGGGSGVLTDIVVGIAGAFVGGMIFRAEGWHAPFGGYAGLIFVAFCGAALLLLAMKIITSATRRR
jgi:uncharacterized membrane protein YeaQ/YmgE (transglycosylase-associated protein family)